MNKKGTIFVNIIKIIRPHQWVKNILVFIPLLMSHNFELNIFITTSYAFIIFSLVASSIYVINDIVDLKADQNHPYKKYRPLAAGLLNINQCKYLIVTLLFICFFLLSKVNKYFLILILSYFVISNLYTFIFKKYPIIDLIILASLYTMRILAGGLIAGIDVSIWLISFSIFFFLSLAAIKRQIEIINTKKLKKKDVKGRGYTVDDQKIIDSIAVSTGYISILILVLYINSPQVLNLYSSPNALWFICIIMLYWISRIILNSSRGRIKDDPIVYAINDKISYLCLVLILCIIWLGIAI
tara:strand:- start:88 stop:981 length:894 start_codon:yes stop_codon:yes gene_type:complete